MRTTDEVMTEWVDDAGQVRRVPEVTIQRVRAILTAVAPAGDNLGPVVAKQGSRVDAHGVVELETGGEISVDGQVGNLLPLGYHMLHERNRDPRPLIICPGGCFRPPGRRWGLIMQLYAARSRGGWGIGDLHDLRTVREWACSLGAGFVVVNPLAAVSPTMPQEPSPYLPASRCFLNPIYLRVEDVPGVGLSDVAALGDAGRALNQADLINRDAVWGLKLAALRRIFGRTGPGGVFARWRIDQGERLEQFATWCALTERYGPSWRQWPQSLRRPEGVAVENFRRHSGPEVTFWAWLQWLAQCQLAAGPQDVAVVHDLPVGFPPSSADAWLWQGLIAEEVSIGAPPDRLSDGQSWGVTPFVPSRLRASGFQPFVESIRALMRCGGLRIDHIMGLNRLWWVLEDDPAAGVFVRYPAQEMFALICLESVRSQAIVIGEDLGTVEPSVQEAMRHAGILTSQVWWFAQDTASWPVDSFATISTHDLPTVAGIWDGSDIVDQRSHGVRPATAWCEELRTRLRALDTRAPAASDVVVAAYQELARAPSALLGVSLDDALKVPRRPNIPGSVGRDNWCLPAPVLLDDIAQMSVLPAIAAAVSR